MTTKQDLVNILRNDPRALARFSEHHLVDAFNRARKSRSTEDYYGLGLNGLDLSGLDLRRVNFENVHLSNATLDQANLEGANLRRADFNYTDALGTNFRHADLRSCHSIYKLLADDADFENADLRGAFLDKKYADYLRRLFLSAHFSGTIITPEQKVQLVSEFKIPVDFLESRFRVVPRGQYFRGPNQYFHQKGLRAYEQARREGRIFTETLNGKTFEYAVVPLQGNEDIHDRGGASFSLCESQNIIAALFGREEARYQGEWWYFVFDNVPEQFREIVAVHEFGEREGGSHLEAMRMEYQRAGKKGVLKEYIAWFKQDSPNGFISNYLLAKESGITLPDEVVEAVKEILPRDLRAWKRHQDKTAKYGLPLDIWILAWKGLSDAKIAERLCVKGYDAKTDIVRYWREQMEIPSRQAIRSLTYLRPN